MKNDLDHIEGELFDTAEANLAVGASRPGASAFDIERVTKRFYERFQKEHAAFIGFINGIPQSKKDEAGDDKWYASVMLNRLMFIYFIQKKGFLDGDTDYLRNRLTKVQALKGRDQFHSFYRYFLLALCHEVLAKKKEKRQIDEDLATLVGNVPYLNGGVRLAGRCRAFPRTAEPLVRCWKRVVSVI